MFKYKLLSSGFLYYCISDLCYYSIAIIIFLKSLLRLENIFRLIKEFLLYDRILLTTLIISMLSFAILTSSSSLDEEPSDYWISFEEFWCLYILYWGIVVSWVFWLDIKNEDDGFTFLKLLATISYFVSVISSRLSYKILLDFSTIYSWFLNCFLHFLAYYKLCFFLRCNAVIWSSFKMTSIAF